MNILIVSQSSAVKHAPNEEDHNIMIRITDPTSDFKKLTYQSRYKEILELKFHDFTEEQAKRIKDDSLILFDNKQAQEILSFYQKHENADFLLIHCDAGISRSAAVALSIVLERGNQKGEQYIWDNYIPNVYVANKMLSLFKKPLVIKQEPSLEYEEFSWD